MNVLKEGLIVSSQALDGNPLKKPEYLAVMAEAAEKGGAAAIRANGVDNIAEMKKRVRVPILGLNKITDDGGMVVITPSFERAKEIAEAGADVIALDATFRKSPIKEDTKTLIGRIHDELHLSVLADVSNFEEALAAEAWGAEYLSTTLAGYTADAPYAPEDKYVPDFTLLEQILASDIRIPVIAEGRFWRPEDVERALKSGAYGVVIGKAITNPMAIASYFCAAATKGICEREHTVSTEERNPFTVDIDRVSTARLLEKINREDRTVADKVAQKLPQITALVDGAFENFRLGGRLLYCGAGTSGRLAVADAAECGPTYGSEKGRVIATMAGGNEAVFCPSEANEDDFSDGYEAAKRLAIEKKDTAIAVSANGNAKFCLGFLTYAKERGAVTGAIVNNLRTTIGALAEYPVEIETGAEVVKGSTRMKAGTAQKMALNMISTALFIKCGCVESNLMVNIRPNNRKLKARAVSMLEILTEKEADECQKVLENNGWDVKKALVILRKEEK